jgi:Thioredoxin
MVKSLIFLFIVLGSSVVHSFEKLPPAYHISYGNPGAPIKVVEYFSFTCPKCLDLIRGEFEEIRLKYIKTGKVHWVFHPHPADLLTLQAMICLGKLDDVQKPLFFEVISKNLDGKSVKIGCAMMQASMEHFRQPLPELGKMTFVEATEEFTEAFAFLKQEDVVASVPTIEINGKICEEFPSRKFLEKQFNALLAKEGQPCK